MSKLNKILLFANIVIVIVIVIVAVANAWTNPTANPPGGGGALFFRAGNVGIGTTAPTERLTIAGGHHNTTLRFSAGGFGQPAAINDAFLSLWASEPGWTWTGAGIGNNILGSPHFGRINTARGASYMRLLDSAIAFDTINSAGTRFANTLFISGGNVGIGTTAPVNRLDVNGDVALTGKHAFRSSDSWLRLNQDGAFTSGVHTPGNFAPMALNVGGLGGWGNPGAGNVWIAGNVGIGTTSPWARLDVAGLGVNAAGFRTINSAGTRNIFLVPELGSGGWNPLSQAGDSGIFYSDAGGLTIGPWSGFPRGIRIDSAGNVGIGTTAPAHRLDVEGNAEFGTGTSNLELVQSGQTFEIRHHDPGIAWRDISLNPHGGNVGIGTTSPQATLDINGTIRGATWGFGGMFTIAGACSRNNPITGGLNCPTGFTAHVIYWDWYAWGACPGAMYLHVCIR